MFNQTESDELTGAVSFFEAEDYRIQVEKKAIIAAGGGDDPNDLLADGIRTCSNYAYLALLSQGYERENILFLAPHNEMDVDGDGALNDVDDVCTSETIRSAIADWGADAAELLVYLVDHGGDKTFEANIGDILEAESLDSWLDSAQTTISGKAVVI